MIVIVSIIFTVTRCSGHIDRDHGNYRGMRLNFQWYLIIFIELCELSITPKKYSFDFI